ncbi:hypothetical protein G4B88_009589 [Cannabis sativa]|uniref:2-methoxy-6-polyprenyl-1,4-benzoquinol methylase, mitochondrial n=1 Tax=Cannabis sativa TaxID=3483 RepID=A0A7J6GE73_CANSA|nr:hypothetical protein G4B88_009589 [Cannabis sativa]
MALRTLTRKVAPRLLPLLSSASPLHSHATSFGFKEVREDEKSQLVGNVFSNVASSYDLMNDVMSAGLHRLWKDRLVSELNPFPGMKHLDVAGGTGDVAFRILEAINSTRRRALQDVHEDGKLSHVDVPVFKEVYDYYSFSVIPTLGQLIAGDRESYQYLVESIRRFPPQGLENQFSFEEEVNNDFIDEEPQVMSSDSENSEEETTDAEEDNAETEEDIICDLNGLWKEEFKVQTQTVETSNDNRETKIIQEEWNSLTVSLAEMGMKIIPNLDPQIRRETKAKPRNLCTLRLLTETFSSMIADAGFQKVEYMKILLEEWLPSIQV